MRRVILTGLATLLAVGCSINKNPGDGNAPVILRMLSIEGVAGGPTAGTATDHLISDVRICGSVWNDEAELSMDAPLKNTDPATTSATAVNDVVLESYQVHFFRTDNHNQQGVDVPYDFSGTLSGTVTAGGAKTTRSVQVVRHTAKLEPPLVALIDKGGERIIDAMAQISVYGRTVGGNAVSATGYLEITFDDFADPATCPSAAAAATPTP